MKLRSKSPLQLVGMAILQSAVSRVQRTKHIASGKIFTATPASMRLCRSAPKRRMSKPHGGRQHHGSIARMPKEWTPQEDLKLLRKLLEVQPDLPTIASSVSAVWPADEYDDQPTAKAVFERLQTIRDRASATTSRRTVTSAVNVSRSALHTTAEPQESKSGSESGSERSVRPRHPL